MKVTTKVEGRNVLVDKASGRLWLEITSSMIILRGRILGFGPVSAILPLVCTKSG